jgi:LysM repeat protein
MQAKVFLSFLLILAMLKATAQRPDDIVSYINTYKEIAMEEMQRTGVPAAIKLAQGIHETQAGTSDLVKKSNNHFGIKCKDTWTGDRVYHDDDARGECFRSYGNPEQSYKDHSDFLKSSARYSFLFQLDPTDYQAWAAGLKKAGYATNYRYSQILVKIIEDYNLEQYTLIAMGKLPATDEIIAAADNTSSTVMQAVSPSVGGAARQTGNITEPPVIRVQPDYPAGEFSINNTRVVFVKAGTALLTVAELYSISFARLLDFNDLMDGDVLKDDQLIFLQRKRKAGSREFHVVEAGETIYDICQAEGIRMENLMANNLLSDNMQPATGEKLYLQRAAATRPLLADEKRAILKESVTIPAKSSSDSAMHVVQTNETLYSISKKYGVSLEQLKEWNKLDTLGVKIGQQLLIRRNQ